MSNNQYENLMMMITIIIMMTMQVFRSSDVNLKTKITCNTFVITPLGEQSCWPQTYPGLPSPARPCLTLQTLPDITRTSPSSLNTPNTLYLGVLPPAVPSLP